MRHPAICATGLDTTRPKEAADGGARDERARRPGGVRGIDLLGEVGDRDRGHTADEQAFEEPPGQQQLDRSGANGTSRPTTVATVTEIDIALTRPMRSASGGPRDHADGQADGGRRDRQRRGRRTDVQVGRDQRKDGLRRVELSEGRDTRAEERGEQPAVRG